MELASFFQLFLPSAFKKSVLLLDYAVYNKWFYGEHSFWMRRVTMIIIERNQAAALKV